MTEIEQPTRCEGDKLIFELGGTGRNSTRVLTIDQYSALLTKQLGPGQLVAEGTKYFWQRFPRKFKP